MGSPQRKGQYIHIAGTNGKGSTSLIIASTLSAAGYRVGRFISPHLHSYFERISIEGESVPAPRFLAYLERIESLVQIMMREGYSRPTEFEVLTAVAFQYFADEKVDLAIMEVGMGGSYDSTNVMVPLVSVITGIDYDHTQYLGNTLQEIAENKAGIIKAKVPVVIGAMADEARVVIYEKARELQAPIFESSRTRIYSYPESVSLEGRLVDIESETLACIKQPYSLLGEYQLQNLATAIAVLEMLKKAGYSVDNEHLSPTLAQLAIPGRLEILQRDPLVVADVAHNPQGSRALANSLHMLLPRQKKVMVCGILDDKDIQHMLEPLLEATRLCIFTRPESPRAVHWKHAASMLGEVRPEQPCLLVEKIDHAVRRGLEELENEEFLLITGSFYLLDRARRFFLPS